MTTRFQRSFQRFEGLRFLSIGGRGEELAQYLAAQGHTRQLHLVESGNDVDKCCHVIEDDAQAVKNSTDVLLWKGRFRKNLLGSLGSYRHAQYVMFDGAIGFGGLAAVLGIAKHVILGHLRFDAAYRIPLPSRHRWFFSFQIKNRSSARARHYLSPDVTLEEFARRLNEQEIRYALLRWFDELPSLAPGEDLDFLVSDDDLGSFHAILDNLPGTIPCDVYSESGLPASDYEAMAYYPPDAARALLAETVVHRSGFRVPSPKFHFVSLAYHAAYQKGPHSGFPGDPNMPVNLSPEHDYLGELSRLATELDLEPPTTLDGLDDALTLAGWRPPLDTLVRLASKNAWLKTKLPRYFEGGDGRLIGLVGLLIRERAVDLGQVDSLIRAFEREGFCIMRVVPLDSNQRQRLAYSARGSNWNRGPSPVGGGGPAVLVIAHDVMPIEPTARDLKSHPSLDNARILRKERIRERSNASLPPDQHSNLVHSSDNGEQALDYVNLVDPDLVRPIRTEIEDLRRQFETKRTVLKDLTRNGRRAKVEVVEFDGGSAVQKTFRPGAERFLEREYLALSVVGIRRTEIPPLLDSGPNHVTIPLYEDSLRRAKGRLLPLEIAKHAIEIARFFYDQGFALMDYTPKNLVVDRRHGVKVIDFEFLHEYKERPPRFCESYDIAGIPADFSGDAPVGTHCSYQSSWQPSVGLSLRSLLDDPVWLQHAKRTQFRVDSLIRRFVLRLSSAFRRRKAIALMKRIVQAWRRRRAS